ncbi:MAG: NAD(P)-dependent alcohol dehydrogenase [Woeseiaceae bacterium]|nr:NAD(P)-dependent alcohol dehydrogenase [Woeseiaceae bacterium]
MSDALDPLQKMRAVVYERYGGPENLQVSKIQVPAPAKNEVRVKVSACAVNLSDWEYLVGSPFYTRLINGLIRPRSNVLGSDVVGVVEKLGSDVSDLKVGQRIMGDFVMTRGGFAEYVCVPASEAIVVPDGLSDEVAACLPQAGGIAATGAAGLKAGTRLLINGAGGGSGTMALQLAKAAGSHVTAVDNDTKIEWLESLGADEVLDYRKLDFAESGKKWDVILDMVATRGPRAIARVLVEGGVYNAVGGGVPVLLSLVLGGRLWRRKCSIGVLTVPSGRELTERVARLALEGRITPHLDSVVPLSSVSEAILRTGRGEVRGKIVVGP